MRFSFSLLFALFVMTGWSQTDSFNFLKTGDVAPDFTVVDCAGEEITLSEKLKEGKVVLVFYRDAWCGYCTKHMSELQDNLEATQKKVVSVVAVSPEMTEFIDDTKEKTGAEISFAHDAGYKLTNHYRTAFQLDEKTLKRYDGYGIDLEETNGNSDNILPVPATFVINQDGTIAFMHFDENYRTRSEVSEILEHL
jgi:peroxiredoxin